MLLGSQASRNVQVTVVTTPLNGGYLRIYGAPRPSAPEAPVTTQTLFAELRFGNPAFGDPSNGVAVANGIAPETNVRASGMPIWFRAFAADGTTAILDGDVPGDLVPSATNLIQGGSLAVTSLVYSRP
jgi:hypothetical protein